VCTVFLMASDNDVPKKSKDPSSKKDKVKGKKGQPKPKDAVKVEVMKKDTPGIKKKKDSVGASIDELYGGTAKEKAGPEKLPDKKKKGPPLLCPDCGHELKEGAKKCPSCGLELGEGEEIVCAVCGGLIDPDSEVCPLCGTRLSMATDEAKAHAAVPDAEIPIEDISHHHHDQMRDKERPTVNVSPEELKKKPTEGAKLPTKGKKGKKGKHKITTTVVRGQPRRRGLLEGPAVVPIAIVITLLLMVVLVAFLPKAQITVDADFSDWSDVTMQKDALNGAPASSQITSYTVKVQGNDVYLYMKANGKMFPGESTTPSYAIVFIDTDRDDKTGYQVGSLGAERMLLVKGYDGAVKETKLYTFEPTANTLDWNGFKESGTFKAKASGSELELCKDLNSLGLNKNSRPSIRFFLRTTSGTVSMSEAPVGLQAGGISVTQYIKAPKTPVAPGTSGQVFMTLSILAKGHSDTLEKLTITRTGIGPVGDVSQVSLWSATSRVDTGKFEDVPGTHLESITMSPNLLVKSGTAVVLTVKMDVWSKASGETLGAEVMSSSQIVFAKSPVALNTVQDEELVTYINHTPAQPEVDGAFGDWNAANSKEQTFTAGGPRPAIDLKDLKSRVEGPGHLKLSLEVTGDFMQGAPFFGLDAVNGTCVSGPACPATGEAITIVYIDADNKTTTGKNLGSIGADYAVIVHGKYGHIEPGSLGFYDYDSGKDSWELISDKGVTAYNDQHRAEIELDITKTTITPPGSTYRYLVELKDASNFDTWSKVIQG
jgi:hypothetical protein